MRQSSRSLTNDDLAAQMKLLLPSYELTERICVTKIKKGNISNSTKINKVITMTFGSHSSSVTTTHIGNRKASSDIGSIRSIKTRGLECRQVSRY